MINEKGEKKSLLGWAMYDFANSAFTTLIVTFVYAAYFTKAIAPNEITGTLLWSRGIVISSLAVAVLAPILGNAADKNRSRKKYLFMATLVAVIFSCLLYFPLPGQTMAALVLFIIANIAYEIGCVFYNAFLPEIAPAEKIGRYSGIGWGLGYAGGLAAMLIAMLCLVNPQVPWFGFSRELGQNIRASNLLVGGWFFIFSLPMFLFVKGDHQKTKKQKGAWGIGQMAGMFREICACKNICRFLIARLIYNDGLVTIFAFGGIYAAGTFDFSFQEIMIFGIVLNVAAGIGAFCFGFCDDLLGSKNTIFMSLAGLVLAALMAVFTSSRAVFWLAGILVGIFSGPNQSASRSLMARLTPSDKEGQFFGFFAFSGKFTAFLGPLLLGILTEQFDSQRAGMSVVLAFFLAGAFVLAKVDDAQSAEIRVKACL